MVERRRLRNLIFFYSLDPKLQIYLDIISRSITLGSNKREKEEYESAVVLQHQVG